VSNGKRMRLRRIREAFCRKCAAHEECASSIVGSEDVVQGVSVHSAAKQKLHQIMKSYCPKCTRVQSPEFGRKEGSYRTRADKFTVTLPDFSHSFVPTSIIQSCSKYVTGQSGPLSQANYATICLDPSQQDH